jgi:hypothetical protein
MMNSQGCRSLSTEFNPAKNCQVSVSPSPLPCGKMCWSNSLEEQRAVIYFFTCVSVYQSINQSIYLSFLYIFQGSGSCDWGPRQVWKPQAGVRLDLGDAGAAIYLQENPSLPNNLCLCSQGFIRSDEAHVFYSGVSSLALSHLSFRCQSHLEHLPSNPRVSIWWPGSPDRLAHKIYSLQKAFSPS